MKYAVVTGSSKGIGKQTGIDLMKKGYFVFFNYGHDESVVESLKSELSQISENYEIIKNDFSSFEKIQKFTEDVRKITEVVDVLVLNVATTDRTKFEEMTMDSFNKVLMTNLTAPCFLVQQFKKFVPNGGNIIFIGAMLGRVPHALSVSYGVSKAGLHMFAQYLVKEFCEQKIRVNVVAPGFVETPWQNNKPEEIRKNIENKISLHRFATPEEISDAVLFVINNTYINGSIVNMDGGYCYK